MGNEQGPYSGLFTSITFSEPGTFETDYAAIQAGASGPIILNLRGVELGYVHGARHGTTLAETLKTHERLDIDSDEGFKIRGYIYLIVVAVRFTPRSGQWSRGHDWRGQ